MRAKRSNLLTNTKSAPLATVILGPVPRILLQRVPNLVNKLALLLHKCWFTQDSWDKPKNDWCRGRMRNFCSTFFKYPSPDAKASPSPSRGDGYRLFRRYTPRNDVFNNTPHSALSRHSLPQGAREHGRSMIEMLGVLAIIAVLSVGGIAGYSKAMMMWRSNVQKNMLTELISGVIRFQSNLPPDIGDAPDIDLTPMLGAMGLLPEETKYDDNWIQDKYGIRAQVGYGYGVYFIRLYYVPTAGEGISPYQELCRNVVQVIKPLANQIEELRSWKTESENSSYSIIYYGKDLASETVEETNRKCKNVAFGVHMTIIFNSK